MSADSRLPNLVIIGAQKCGTTALYQYLARHPQISMSRPKELDFFITERNWSKGVEWYVSHFDPSAPVRGESSPNYTAARRFPGVVERMRVMLPDAKLIYLARDPIERMISQWIHVFTRGGEKRPLQAALMSEDYLDRSRYARQIGLYLDAFPREQILFLDTDALRDERRETLRRVFAFLGVDPDFWSRSFLVERHRSASKRQLTPFGRRVAASRLGALVASFPPTWGYRAQRYFYYPISRPLPRPSIDPGLRATLAAHLRADADEFRRLSGLSFPGWSI